MELITVVYRETNESSTGYLQLIGQISDDYNTLTRDSTVKLYAPFSVGMSYLSSVGNRFKVLNTPQDVNKSREEKSLRIIPYLSLLDLLIVSCADVTDYLDAFMTINLSDCWHHTKVAEGSPLQLSYEVSCASIVDSDNPGAILAREIWSAACNKDLLCKLANPDTASDVILPSSLGR